MRLQTSAGGEDWNRSAPLSTSPATKGDASAMSTSDDLSQDQRDLWNRVRARLKASVGEDVFTSWFARLELEEIVDDLAPVDRVVGSNRAGRDKAERAGKNRQPA